MRPPRLDADLTPVGAQRAGNADGSIPAWAGGLPKAPPIDPKVGCLDPFADDKPLVTIRAANAAEYKDLLSAGHMALLKRDARTFRMHVYPTRRSAVPFPIPEDGLRAMWNHVFRWRGGSAEPQYIWAPIRSTTRSTPSPRRMPTATPTM